MPGQGDAGSLYGDRRRRLGREAVVPGPAEFQLAALRGDGGELDERIGGDRGMEIGAEYLLAVVAADEVADDVARNARTRFGVAEARLHHVADQRLDLDDLALVRSRGTVDDPRCHLLAA